MVRRWRPHQLSRLQYLSNVQGTLGRSQTFPLAGVEFHFFLFVLKAVPLFFLQSFVSNFYCVHAPIKTSIISMSFLTFLCCSTLLCAHSSQAGYKRVSSHTSGDGSFMLIPLTWMKYFHFLWEKALPNHALTKGFHCTVFQSIIRYLPDGAHERDYQILLLLRDYFRHFKEHESRL